MCLALALVLLIAMPHAADAATYYSMTPGDEVCTSIQFGNNGRGEYTLHVSDPDEDTENPWVDVHFTSLLARPDNIVIVPLCFNAIGRTIGESATLVATVAGPDGTENYEYGICVGRQQDVDMTGTLEDDPCLEMGLHTDIFSAALTEPELYVDPGEEATYTLVLDSSVPATLNIAKASGAMTITASESAVEAGDAMKEVELSMAAPDTPGEYDFSVMVSAEGCDIDDCRREVFGKLIVNDPQEPDGEEASFYLWLTPKTKSVIGKTATTFILKVRNYGIGQQITITASTEEGLDTNFEPYTVFINEGGEKTVTLTVLPQTDDKRSYKINAAAVGEDGSKRSDEGWLTIDEMVADAEILGEEDFIDEYEQNEGSTLEDWAELDSGTNYNTDDNGDIDGDSVSGGTEPNMLLMAAVIGIVIAVLIVVFLVYKKMQSGASGEGGWGQLAQQ